MSPLSVACLNTRQLTAFRAIRELNMVSAGLTYAQKESPHIVRNILDVFIYGQNLRGALLPCYAVMKFDIRNPESGSLNRFESTLRYQY